MVARRATGVYAVALLLLLTAWTACSGSSSPNPNPTNQPSEGATPATTLAPPTPSPTPTDTFAVVPPDRDLIDLAVRYRGLSPDAPRLARTAPISYAVGDAAEFRVFDLAGEPGVGTVTATLRHVTEHAYFFVAEGRSVAPATLQTIGADFESLVYPAVTEAFGQEWIPGVDSDPRMTILHVDLNGAGGYVAGSDEFPTAAAPNSNEREMITLDVGILNTPGAPYNALAAHELQHMVHWNADASEDSWVNEGLAQVAAELVGGGLGLLNLYLASPGVGLVDWPEGGDTAVHYAASQLFFGYLLDQYGGRENAAALVNEPQDGIDGVQSYLDGFGAKFETVFADWLAATYLSNESGKYSHAGIDTSAIRREPIDDFGGGERTLNQFGADFLEIDSAGTFTLSLATSAAPPAPLIDGAYYWSGAGDGIDSTMTTDVDLSSVETATLTFDVWHEIERGWDYAYVAASIDDGRTWQALEGSQTSDYDPVGLSYGPGYTGSSGGWVGESIDLSDYAGGAVRIRFEYVTDGSTNGSGFAVDNIEVPEIGLSTDGGQEAGWVGDGFTIVSGPRQQLWSVQLIDRATGDVERLEHDRDGNLSIEISGPVAIIVSPTIVDTRAAASYSWTLTE